MGPVQLPKSMSPELKDLLMKMLSRIPTERLGANGAWEIKAHPFFKSIDWSAFTKPNHDGSFKGINVPPVESLKITKKMKAKFDANALAAAASSIAEE